MKIWRKMRETYKNNFDLQVTLSIFAAFIVIFSTYIIFGLPNTTQYAVNSALTAVAKHDVKEFNKHFDLDNVLSDVYDSLGNEILGEDKEKFIATAKTEIINYIQTGQWPESSKYTYHQELSTILEQASYKNPLLFLYTYDVSWQDDYTALLGFNIYDKKTKKEITLFLELEKVADGMRIKKISNFSDFIAGKGEKFWIPKSFNGFPMARHFYLQ